MTRVPNGFDAVDPQWQRFRYPSRVLDCKILPKRLLARGEAHDSQQTCAPATAPRDAAYRFLTVIQNRVSACSRSLH